jgi:protein-S-isoprenylcysteine O-methyltransferase Ste14
MHATRFEYRFRFVILVLIFALGFGLVPLLINTVPGIVEALGIATKSTWLVLASMLWRAKLLNFSAATTVVLAVAIVFAAVAAWLRVWGTAYVGAQVVKSQDMQADALLADGPYRRTRNPLYLGLLLHTFALAILMPPIGAVITIALVWVLQIRLALAEEPFLAEKYGAAYAAYKQAVPRFLPSPSPAVAAAGVKPRWVQALLGETYFVGAVVVLAVFGWDFNATPIVRGLIIAFGVSLVMRALLPQETKS